MCVCVHVSVHPCVNPELVHAITCDTVTPVSPNLGQTCKTPWLKSLVFWEVINCDLQGQVELWAFSALGLLWHGWAWLTCTTSTTLPCKSDTSCYCPTKATWFIRFTLVFARAPSAVSHCVLTAICNENRELSQMTPEATTRAPETPHQQHFYSQKSGK